MTGDQDCKAATGGAIDRGEPTSLMEPLALPAGSRHRPGLSDLAMELASASAGFRRSLPRGLLGALSALVRSMNCYYSNLIEGHATHPIDIERAMQGDYSHDSAKRNLQMEARAHVEVQRWIDDGGVSGRATSSETLRDIHRRFCEGLPDDLLTVTDPATHVSERVIPGAFRTRDVKAGPHVPVSAGAVPRFMDRFAEVHGALGRAESILAAAAAHHRLLWIHPFLDGNGRVARLMSHAALLEMLDTGGIWSVARGLARNVGAYKGHLMSCDAPRRNDLDGRGTLSEEALAAFTLFFLQTCLDQARFMESLLEPGRLRDRIRLWADEEARAGTLPHRSGALLEAVVLRGELARGDVPAILNTSERSARRVVSALLERGVLTSATSRATLAMAFPATLAARWLPGLFPEQAT